jgi:hypothetical protein
VAEVRLTQIEAEELIQVPKHRIDEYRWSYPSLGGKVIVPLSADNRKESFLLDITRGRIELSKCTHQNRVDQTIILLRLDIGGPPHRNPDNIEVGSDHLHIYREGYAVKFAVPLPNEFSNISDQWDLLQRFMTYCNIVTPPLFETGLFI